MKVMKSGFFVAALTVFSQSVTAVPFAHEARSLAMGNIGVATADIATAAFANPAMLAFQREDDDFSLLLSAGGFFNDNDGLIDNIDQFQQAYDNYNAAGDLVTSSAALAEMQSIAVQVNNKVIAPELSASVAAGFTTEVYSMALSARLDVIIAAALTDISTNVLEVLDPNKNKLNIAGAKTTEIGFSIARSMDVMGRKLSIGITPKIVAVEAVNFSESILTAETGLEELADNGVEDLGDFTTLDIGVVMGLTENIQAGLVVKNLLTKDLSYSAGTLSFDMQLKAGVAFRNDFLTIGADLDLIENDSALSGQAFSGLKRQNLSLGVELDVFDYVQLRAGMIKNIANAAISKDLLTAGVGIWLGFNLDVAVIKGDGDSMGAYVQTGFKF